jgi:hypothetical protein
MTSPDLSQSVVHAPEFPSNLDWLNTGGRVLRLEDLRGKIALLEFWVWRH